MRRFLLVGALCAILGLTAAACKRPVPAPAPAPPPPPAAPPPPPPPPPKPVPPPPPPPAPLTEDQIFAKKTVDQLNAERPLGDVLFDLRQRDAAGRRPGGRVAKRGLPEAMAVSADHGRRTCRLRAARAEYNLALGERRAAAVKDYIVSLGVAADRVTTVSKGKEQPVCTEETEACWQRNRRGFHIITAK